MGVTRANRFIAGACAPLQQSSFNCRRSVGTEGHSELCAVHFHFSAPRGEYNWRSVAKQQKGALCELRPSCLPCPSSPAWF